MEAHCLDWFEVDHQTNSNETKGPVPQGQEEWGHIQFPEWGYWLWWGVYRGNIKDPWWKLQGTPKTTLPHPCTHPTN